LPPPPSQATEFNALARRNAHLTEYFKLPVEAVVEIGREVSI
jgi:K+ transporter